MKIVATIEARMSSSRLPGKILKPILDEPLLGRMVERVQFSKLIDEIVVATTDQASDDVTATYCNEQNIACFRGSESDVLDRVLNAAKFMRADLIVQLTGDCPLVDYRILDQAIRLFIQNGESWDFVSTPLNNLGLPRGMGVRIFPTFLLEEISQLTHDPSDREHVSTYIYEGSKRYKLGVCELLPKLVRPELRLTVDTDEDLDLVRQIFDELYLRDKQFSLSDIIDLLDHREDLQLLNSHIQQKPIRRIA